MGFQDAEAPDEDYIFKRLNPHVLVAIAPKAGLVFRFNDWAWEDSNWSHYWQPLLRSQNMTPDEYDACYLDVDAGGVFDGSGNMMLSLERDFSEAIFNGQILNTDRNYDWESGNLESIEEEIKKGGYRGWTTTKPKQNLKYQFNQSTNMLAIAGTVVGFGAFGYAIVKLTEKDWKQALMYGAGGAAVLTLVGWKLREVFGAPSTPHNFMKRADVEKILDESAGKIVGVTFIKKDGSERTLVGRIGKRYTSPGTYPAHSKAARRGRGHFTIYDMQKGAFRLINMNSVIGIRAEGTSHTA